MAPGDEIGRFRIDAPLADGSWRARDLRSGAVVRLRQVDPFGEEQEFLAGARPLLALDDPSVLPVADVGMQADGSGWVAELWQPGETLLERVNRVGRLPADHLLAVAEGLFAGLAAAHARGIRDGAITPERLKILGDPPHTVLLVQPGLGTLLTDLVPDPDFAPPEGSAATVAADLFGAAATLCFAALGASVPAGQALDLAAPRLPAALLDALRQSLDPDPRDRPHSVEPLKRAVQSLRARPENRLVPTPALVPAKTPPRKADPAAATAVPPHRRDESATEQQVRVDPGADTEPPKNPERMAFETTLAGSQAPHFDFSADATMPPEPALNLALLTLPQAPPVPERRPLPSLPPEPVLASEPAAAAPVADPVVVLRPPRPRPEATPPPPPDHRSLYLATGGILLLGVAAIILWWAVRERPAALDAQAQEPVEAAAETIATLAAPPTLDPNRNDSVRVIPDPFPARFVQVKSGTVLCESVDVCSVPIDEPTRVEKAGYRSVILNPDDLFDRRGGRWRVKLYPGR